MPTPDAELLETLLARVMRLVVMHGDAAPADPARNTLSMAEGVLLVDLLVTGNATQQQLADRLSLDKSRISRLCAALERKHLIDRKRDESDRRTLLVGITSSGAAAATRLRRAWHVRHERILAAMTSDERHALLLGLHALARELASVPSHHERQEEVDHQVVAT